MDNRDEVLAEWIEGHWDRLLQVAEKYRGRAVTGQDIVLEALLIAWNKRGQLRDQAAVGSWLEGFVRNVGLKAATKRKRRRELIRKQYHWFELSNVASPDDILEEKTKDEALEEAISGLRQPHQAIIRYRLEGLSYGQIAKKLGMPLGTVKSHRSRAVRALYEVLGGGEA